jgi:hypothetical protein
VLIIGNFTGMVGDPIGRSQIRRPQSKDEVAEYARTYPEQAAKVLGVKRRLAREVVTVCHGPEAAGRPGGGPPRRSPGRLDRADLAGRRARRAPAHRGPAGPGAAADAGS